MQIVKPKKQLGQHFLRNETIAKRIAYSLTGHGVYKTILEIGPGTGVLSKYLMENSSFRWMGIDVDKESIEYLKQHFAPFQGSVLEADFLKIHIPEIVGNENIAIIGNFPYNISSQILFKILENRNQVKEIVGMFQKEVAQRVVAGPGGKVNGILSILCQAYYNVEYLFQVDENNFFPPPRVKSAVIRLKRNDLENLDCDEKMFFSVVKIAFNQRRKTLRNALKTLQLEWDNDNISDFRGKRAEQLCVRDFIKITNAVNKK